MRLVWWPSASMRVEILGEVRLLAGRQRQLRRAAGSSGRADQPGEQRRDRRGNGDAGAPRVDAEQQGEPPDHLRRQLSPHGGNQVDGHAAVPQ